MMGVKYPLGRVVWTRSVNKRIAESTEFARFVSTSLRRHANGDWGDMVEEDKRENEFALQMGNLRLFSAYEHQSQPKVWIITEADRSATTILFPEDY